MKKIKYHSNRKKKVESKFDKTGKGYIRKYDLKGKLIYELLYIDYEIHGMAKTFCEGKLQSITIYEKGIKKYSFLIKK